jgi:hypothetical protein
VPAGWQIKVHQHSDEAHAVAVVLAVGSVPSGAQATSELSVVKTLLLVRY